MVSTLTMQPPAVSLPLMLELDVIVVLPELEDDGLLPEQDEDAPLVEEELLTEEVSFTEDESFVVEESPVAERSLSMLDESVMSVSEESSGVVISVDAEAPQAAKNARDTMTDVK